MNDKCNYSNIIISKSGVSIPVFASGKTVDSRYDPEKESLRIVEGINEKTDFIILLGIASGQLIKTILKQRPYIFILALEFNQNDIDYLMQLEEVQKLAKMQNVCFCPLEQLFEKITQLYIPAFYGNLEVIEQRGWTSEYIQYIPQIKEIIQKALGIVSADFSVQSHFGKLWQHNILSNIKLLEKSKNIQDLVIDTNKTALVLAAGPSLDKTIINIKENRKEYFLIATDTAFSVLLSHKVFPDTVVSLDGQNISNLHFIHSNEYDFTNTIFLFDLCANDSAAKKILNQNGLLCFFTSGHPLSMYINTTYQLLLPQFFSGSGTVTISALDFALQAGFKNIQVAAADFSYSNGKAYAKGTYLDRIYNQQSQRINNSQKQFCSLMYRIELIPKSDKVFTTQILEAYRTSFEEFLNSKNLAFKKENDLYKINNNNSINSLKSLFSSKAKTVDGNTIMQELKKSFTSLNPERSITSIYDLTNIDICLLPLISWYKYHDNKDKTDFNYYYKKALGGIIK